MCKCNDNNAKLRCNNCCPDMISPQILACELVGNKVLQLKVQLMDGHPPKLSQTNKSLQGCRQVFFIFFLWGGVCVLNLLMGNTFKTQTSACAFTYVQKPTLNLKLPVSINAECLDDYRIIVFNSQWRTFRNDMVRKFNSF